MRSDELPRTVEAGVRFIWTGEPCLNGHVEIRRVDKRGYANCVACAGEALARWYIKKQRRLAGLDDAPAPVRQPEERLEPTGAEVERIAEALGDAVWRKTSARTSRWVGVPIAEAMGLDLGDEVIKGRVTKLVAEWVAAGILVDRKPARNKRAGWAWRGGQ